LAVNSVKRGNFPSILFGENISKILTLSPGVAVRPPSRQKRRPQGPAAQDHARLLLRAQPYSGLNKKINFFYFNSIFFILKMF
jgi:hypothetical protein